MNGRSILYVALMAFLLGCASPRQAYVAPDGVPLARVNSGIRTPFDHDTSILITVMDEGSCDPLNAGRRKNMRTLFRIEQSASVPEGYVRIETGKPMWIRYAEENSKGRCEIMVEVQFEPDRDYTFFGGKKIAVNMRDHAGCMFGIKDQTTGLPVKPVKLTQEVFCSK